MGQPRLTGCEKSAEGLSIQAKEAGGAHAERHGSTLCTMQASWPSDGHRMRADWQKLGRKVGNRH